MTRRYRMYILLFFVVLIIVYIVSFKDNFTQENIEKVTPVLMLVAIFVVFISVLSAIV
jgi:uncharacterized membrane protein